MQTTVKRWNFHLLQTITLLLLFFAGMNVGNRYYYFCFVATALFIGLRRSYVFDLQLIALLLLSLFLVCFSPSTQSFSITATIKPFLYPMAYLVGRNFFMGKQRHDFEGKQKQITAICIILSAGPFIHYFINYLLNFDSVERNTVDVWTGTVLSATNQAALACMMLGVAIALLFAKTKLYVKIAAFVSLAVIFLYNLVLSGRTLFVMAAIIVLACVLYSAMETKSVQTVIGIVALLLVVAVIVGIIYAGNLFGIADYIEGSNFYARFFDDTEEDMFSTTRGELKAAYFEHFSEGIWGGAHIYSLTGRYAHDLFLDTYDEAGIFALLAVICFMTRSAYVLLKMLKNRNCSFAIRLLMLCLYVALYAEFCVEPILQGVPWLFALFCFIHGMFENINCDMKRQKHSITDRSLLS